MLYKKPDPPVFTYTDEQSTIILTVTPVDSSGWPLPIRPVRPAQKYKNEKERKISEVVDKLDRNESYEVIWAIDRPDLATIEMLSDGSVKLTALQSGEINITASISGITQTQTLHMEKCEVTKSTTGVLKMIMVGK